MVVVTVTYFPTAPFPELALHCALRPGEAGAGESCRCHETRALLIGWRLQDRALPSGPKLPARYGLEHWLSTDVTGSLGAGLAVHFTISILLYIHCMYIVYIQWTHQYSTRRYAMETFICSYVLLSVGVQTARETRMLERNRITNSDV